jgi:hypothetical protein
MAQVIKPKRSYTAGDAPTTSDLAVGEIAINTADAKLYVRDNSNNIVAIAGGGGTSSGATTDVTQSSHGLAVKDCIRHNGSSWVKAQANSNSTLALGVVTAVADSNTFTVAQSGRFELSSHGLTVGQWYYLDASTAGGLTTTEPSISQPLVYVEGSNHLFVFPYRPTNLLVNGSTSIVPGDDTVATAKLQDGAVTTAKIADNAITSAKIGVDVIVAADLAANSITVSELQDDAVTTAKIADDAITSALIADDAVVQAAIADDAVDEARIQISNAGSNGQVLTKQSGNTGGLTWATVGGAYSDWTILTTTPTTLAAKGQYVCNDTTARTHTLPSGSAGDSIIICNAGSATVTLARTSSQKINSAAEDGSLPQGNSVQLVYVDGTIGWFEI